MMKIDALIEQVLEGHTPSILKAHSTALSHRYRDRHGSLQITSYQEALAYAAVRMPATFGAARKIMDKITAAMPSFAPSSMMDFGSGPGTMVFAARETWNSLRKTVVIETNSFMNDIARKMINALPTAPPIENISDIKSSYDLVTAGYVLNETGPDPTLIEKLWAATRGVLILVEPGTPAGFELIAAARDQLLKAGAHIIAPCPHALTCPLAISSQERWCHFSARIPRSKLHRYLKDDASLGWEDEKFSYIAVSRTPVAAPRWRALGTPHGGKVVRIETCQKDGTAPVLTFSRRNEDYKTVRKMGWGDAL